MSYPSGTNAWRRRSVLRWLSAPTALLALGLLQGCASTPLDTLSAPLVGTSWQLLAIQSMDDAQSLTQVTEPERFTASFGRDGRVSLRLDCNRGEALWDATATDTSSGRLSIGPVKSSKALCAPPQLDQRIARDLVRVRSYLLREDRLYMSLMADGGIYEWRRASR